MHLYIWYIEIETNFNRNSVIAQSILTKMDRSTEGARKAGMDRGSEECMDCWTDGWTDRERGEGTEKGSEERMVWWTDE